MKYLSLMLFVVLFFTDSLATSKSNIKTAVFAGGCFWCVQADFDKIKGVLKTQTGYSGGLSKNVNYELVSAGKTKHAEVVKVYYDSSLISYDKLVEKFYRTIDPTVQDRQFCDKGSQYRSAIFYQNDQEKLIAQTQTKKVAKILNTKIYTQIEPLGDFILAESYHQNYYVDNPLRYKYYRYSCGRDKRLEQLWN